MTLAPEVGVPMWLDDRIPRVRAGNRRNSTRPWGLYPCADGFVSFLVLQPAHWRAMARWIAEETGMEAVLEEAFVDLRVRWEASEFIDDCTEALTRPAHEGRPVSRGPAPRHPDHAGQHRRRSSSPTAILTSPDSGGSTTIPISAR